jgi:ribosomal protein S18 acetylase RimI-like enzyme
MIRPTTPADTPILLQLTEGTGVFKPHEVEALKEVLDDYHETSHRFGHRAVTLERGSRVLGYAYYAPAAMTDRAWELWWIAVTKDTQSRGLGAELLRHAEEDVRRQNGRILFIDTSSQAHYAPTRRFYAKHGYEQAAVLKDFYGDGDDKVVFRKRLAG